MRGAPSLIARTSDGSRIVQAWSVNASRNRSSLRAGSNSSPRTMASIRGRTVSNSRSKRSARTVRSYIRPLRTSRGSLNISLSRSNTRLIAGWLKKFRLAADVTFRSSNRARRWTNRFRSRLCKCTVRIPGILTMHGTNGSSLRSNRSRKIYGISGKREEEQNLWQEQQ